MAETIWVGGASAVAQVQTYTPANVEINDVFTLRAYNRDRSDFTEVSFTATAATVANVTAGLALAWNNSSNALCTPVTASDDTTHVTLTADEAGVPFDVTTATTDGGGTGTQTLAEATTTASSGSKDWNTAANWSTAAVPVSGDDVRINQGADDIYYGLYQSGVSLKSLHVTGGFEGESIGGDDCYLVIDVDNTGGGNVPEVRIESTCRGGIWLNGTMTTVLALKAPPVESALKLGSSSDIDDLRIGSGVRGKWWIADSATVDRIHVGAGSIAQFQIGNVASLDELNVYGGRGKCLDSLDTAGVILVTGGELTLEGGTASSEYARSVKVYGGTVYLNNDGDFGTGGSGGVYAIGGTTRADRSNATAGVTWENSEVHAGATLITGSAVSITKTNATLNYGGRELATAGGGPGDLF